MALRLLICSDLHVDILGNDAQGLLDIWKDIEVDAIVLAGDTGEVRDNKTIKFLKELAKYHPIILIFGNHDHWGLWPEKTLEIFQKELPQIHLLTSDKVLEFNGQKFVGDTLWYPQSQDKHFPDFKRIHDFVPWYYEQNEKTVKFLKENVTPDTIVVTHHLPTKMAIHPNYANDEWNKFFCYDMTDFIMERQPKLWVMGHSHQPCDFKLGKTRLILNARGYPSEDQEIPFNPNLIVEI
jgi:Icc-related predicted phosphoesterase